LPDDELRLYWCPDAGSPEPRRQRVDRLLRAALAPLLGLPPAALAFSREPRGRPFLRRDGAPDFNLSDTPGGTLIALCRQGRVGVDLERLDRAPPVARLAHRWFSAPEALALQALDPEAARIAFLQLWTAKEASCKATGTGIFGHLGQWRFAVGPAQPELAALPTAAGAATRWSFRRLSPSAQHTAVIALCDAPALRLSAYRLSA
jgi:4'-phosphopantetheinyl transferase